jgi:hypothetical protein
MKVDRHAVAESAPRSGRQKSTPRGARRPHEPRGQRQGPQTAPAARPAARPARAKNTTQAKARAKARKAKAPKVIRPPLRERLRERIVARLVGLDLRPQTLLARVPFVVLVMGALGAGLGLTLWLSTASAQRSYQLGSARSLNDALTQQKEALERDVLQAESAPALADAARNLGMIPSKDTAHLVLDPAGNWVVVGKPKPAEGAPPPPLNTKLPDPAPPPAPVRPTPRPMAGAEVPTRLVPGTASAAAGATEVPVRIAPPTDPLAPRATTGTASSGPAMQPGLTLVPVDPVPAQQSMPPLTDAVTPQMPSAPGATQ